MKEINFMGLRKPFGIFSVVVVLASLAYIMIAGVQKSVDFEGGSKLTVAFNTKLDIAAVREQIVSFEPSAQVVSLDDNSESRSEFNIKIKNPQTNDKRSDISPERRTQLEHAFANLVSEHGSFLELLKGTEVEALASKLASEDIYAITGTDAEKSARYNQLADLVKGNLEGATDLRGLTEAADSERASDLAPRPGAGLSFAQPHHGRSAQCHPDQVQSLGSRRRQQLRGRVGSDRASAQ